MITASQQQPHSNYHFTTTTTSQQPPLHNNHHFTTTTTSQQPPLHDNHCTTTTTDILELTSDQVPAEFFRIVLGPKLKYSCGLFKSVPSPQPSLSPVLPPLTASHNLSQPLTTYHNLSQPLTAYHNLSQPLTTSHNLSQPLTTSHNLSQHLTSSHNISQPLPRTPTSTLSEAEEEMLDLYISRAQLRSLPTSPILQLLSQGRHEPAGPGLWLGQCGSSYGQESPGWISLFKFVIIFFFLKIARNPNCFGKFDWSMNSRR